VSLIEEQFIEVKIPSDDEVLECVKKLLASQKQSCVIGGQMSLFETLCQLAEASVPPVKAEQKRRPSWAPSLMRRVREASHRR
jgi:hypothetical protein